MLWLRNRSAVAFDASVVGCLHSAELVVVALTQMLLRIDAQAARWQQQSDWRLPGVNSRAERSARCCWKVAAVVCAQDPGSCGAISQWRKVAHPGWPRPEHWRHLCLAPLTPHFSFSLSRSLSLTLHMATQEWSGRKYNTSSSCRIHAMCESWEISFRETFQNFLGESRSESYKL